MGNDRAGWLLFWCSRVLNPPQAHEYILAELHGGHLGGARMKSLTCKFVWWPGMDHQKLKKLLKPVQNVNSLHQLDLLPHCVHGNGLTGLGHAFILTLLDLWTVTYFCHS